MKNKLDKLTVVSKSLWAMATILMVLNWINICNFAFRTYYHYIDDTFLYIGILGGWLFIEVFYVAMIILFGFYMIRIIEIIRISVTIKK